MKKLLVLLLALLMLSCVAASNAESLLPFIADGLTWDTPEGEMDRAIQELKFEPGKVSQPEKGFYLYYNGKMFKQNIKWILADYTEGYLNGIHFFVLKGKTHYSATVKALCEAYGPESEGWRVQLINGREESFQALVWHTADADVYLTAVASSTLAKAKKGSAAFTVSIVRKGFRYEWTTGHTVVQGEETGYVPADGPCPITVTNVKISSNSTGSTIVAFALKNNSGEKVKNITYYEETYDKNGRFLAPNVIYHYHWGTYEKTIKPGARSNKLNRRIGGVEGTYEVRIAVKTWQIGDTVYGLKDEDLVWHSFTR